MALQQEAALYAPVKLYFESLGYTVKGEVHACDLVAKKDDSDEPIIVELKKAFTLSVLYQGLDRLQLSDQVYVAVGAAGGKGKSAIKKQRDMVHLCRRIGLGLIVVRFPAKRKPQVEVLCHPEPYIPRKANRKRERLLREFDSRTGDFNVGGTTRQKRMTAYREKAIACAWWLKQQGQLRPRDLRELTGEMDVQRLLRDNYYGWFESRARGVYGLTERGEAELELPQYQSLIKEWNGQGKAGNR